MISYYGSKTKIVKYYPAPRYGKIIEPFAGAAKYSLLYFDREIILVDKYRPLIVMWKWLQQCSENDILSLPKFKRGESIKGRQWDCEGQAVFMGFMMGRGLASPQYAVSTFVASEKQYHFDFAYRRIAADLFKIKHWDIREGSYSDLTNEEATWFIDPPYQFGGKYYKENSINYTELRHWVENRKGQKIVCENTKADWMSFKPLVEITGCKYKTTEALWVA